MRLASLRSFALSRPGATANRQWGDDLVFKVAGKMFLVIRLDGETAGGVSFRCPPVVFRRLTRGVDGIIPAPYLARRSWVLLEDPAVLSESELHHHISISYDLVRAGLPKRIQAALG